MLALVTLMLTATAQACYASFYLMLTTPNVKGTIVWSPRLKTTAPGYCGGDLSLRPLEVSESEAGKGPGPTCLGRAATGDSSVESWEAPPGTFAAESARKLSEGKGGGKQSKQRSMVSQKCGKKTDLPGNTSCPDSARLRFQSNIPQNPCPPSPATHLRPSSRSRFNTECIQKSSLLLFLRVSLEAHLRCPEEEQRSLHTWGRLG